MKNMKVALKLSFSFILIILFAIIIGISGIFGMSRMQKSASDLYDYNLIAISALADIRELFNQERNDMRAIFLSKEDFEVVQSLINGFPASTEKAAHAFAMYESTITDESQETAYYAAKDAYLGSFEQMKKETFALIAIGDFDTAYQIFVERGSFIIPPIVNGLKASTLLNDQEAQDKNAATDSLYHILWIGQIGLLLVAITISLLLAFYLSKMISKPLVAMATAFMQIGIQGDLELPAEADAYARECSHRKDELGQCSTAALSLIEHLQQIDRDLGLIAKGDLSVPIALLSERDTIGRSVSQMLDSLNQIFNEINASSSQVSIGSKQVADGAQALAQGATQQAATIEQLSASIDEIAHKTKQNADVASEASHLSMGIRNDAENGSIQMKKLMQAVGEINDASGQINKVIKVIDDIAFQTNILALNAAVEAARAGNAGKGFAVVAEEVRNLAGKSAEAAKDTGELIEDSITKSNLGLSIATETFESLTQIVSGINRSTEIVMQIAQSSNEQAHTVDMINTGLNQVVQVVQQNSATAEESAAASQEMSGQSSMLEHLLSQFKLKRIH